MSDMNTNKFYSPSVACFIIGLSVALSQSVQAVETLGKQPIIERYDAPIIEDKTAGEFYLDLPKLLQQKLVNTDQKVLTSLRGLLIEYGNQSDKKGAMDSDNFVLFTGQSKLPSAIDDLLKEEIRSALSHFANQPLTLGQLQEVQHHISDLYREQGYPLMSVVTPPQEVVDGVIRVRIHEFYIGQIRYQFKLEDGSYGEKGEHWTPIEHLDNILQDLKELPTASQMQVNKPIAYLNSHPYRQAKVVFEPGSDVNATNINVLIDEKRPWGLTAGYNNYATSASGINRFSLGANLSNIPFNDDQLALQLTLGDDIDEFLSYSVIYKKPTLDGNSLTINASYTDTASSNIPGISSASKTWQMLGNYNMPGLYKGEGWQLDATSSLSYRRFERYSYFDSTQVGDAVYESVQLGVGGSYAWQDDHVSNKLDLKLHYNLKGITSKNTDQDFQKFHNNDAASDYHFTVINYARQQDLSALGLEGISTETQISWQNTSSITAGADNFSLGGSGVLKAYESSEAAGDEGWYFVQKLHYPAFQPEGGFIKQARISNFIEIGRARGRNSSGTKLADIGMELSLSLKKNINCGLSAALATVDGKETHSGDGRVFVACNLTY